MKNIQSPSEWRNPHPASTYAEVVKAVSLMVAGDRFDADPTVIAYMVARAALLWVRGRQGNQNAGAMAYRLADEISTADVA